jgi:hypothetical protein
MDFKESTSRTRSPISWCIYTNTSCFIPVTDWRNMGWAIVDIVRTKEKEKRKNNNENKN